MIKRYRREKGITLIALIITIVILLILAGIGIQAITQIGLFDKVKHTSKVQQEAEMKENLILALNNLQIEREGKATLNDLTQEWIETELKEYNPYIEEDTLENKLIVMTKSSFTGKFLVNQNMDIINVEYNTDKVNYVHDGLLLHYDATNNTENGHDSNAQEWKNLANDSNNGILNGNPTWNDDSLYFDGTNDFIDCGKVGLENNHSFTYECAISYINLAASNAVIMGLHSDYIGGSILGIDSASTNYLKFHLDSYGSQRVNGSIALDDGDIHQIIATYNSEESKLYLYIDGKLDSSKVVASNLTYPDLDFNIGRWVGGQSQYYKGNIHNVLIYNKYLNNDEVLNNYEVDKQKYVFEKKDDGKLLLYYDSLNNTGENHSTGTQEWKNLANDSNNGILKGNPTWSENYLTFDGIDDYIDCGKIGLENNHSFTYECTISYSESQNMKTLMGLYGSSEGGSSLGIDDTSANYLKFHLNSYGYQRINSTKTLDDGKIHNIIATYKNNKLILYIDGNVNNSATIPQGITYPNLNFNIGRWVGGQSQYYKGKLYSVKVYNKYLTKDEIFEDYQYEKNRYNIE